MSLFKTDAPEAEEKHESKPAAGFTRPAAAYRINGRWINGAFHLVGPAQDFADVGAILTKASTGAVDGNGNVTVDFDGEGQPPVKQAGN